MRLGECLGTLLEFDFEGVVSGRVREAQRVRASLASDGTLCVEKHSRLPQVR